MARSGNLEAKNVFLKSKMNKDLDSRLISPNEYRDGQNIAVSKSEGSDVGALENILGNLLLTDFGLGDLCNIEIIGRYMDVTNDRIFVMLTNFTDNSPLNLALDITPLSISSNIDNIYYAGIHVYNIKTKVSEILVGGRGDKGRFLNFSKTHPIHHINLLEDLLFWTDNRNQPRKINVERALGQPANSPIPYYSNEDHISVAKYYPYSTIDLSSNLNGTWESTMRDRVSEFLPDKYRNPPNGSPNPYYSSLWPGDPNFIVEKFLRFSYRFKFDDGEYSVMAPFTQTAFIPEQDGYFISGIDDDGESWWDEDRTYQSTEVKFMKNKVNDIDLILNAPDGMVFGSNNQTDIHSSLKITDIEILYKESDGLSVKVVDSISWEDFQWKDPLNPTTGYNTNQFIYNYQSRKPYKTLPERETIRVYDKTPIRSATQEVVGNRLVYGNYINKHTPPKNLDYNVIVDEKADTSVYQFSPGGDNRIEYPNHTLKQNRTYQVGIVLSDRYGRQSTVILSSVDDGVLGIVKYSGSTVYHPYSGLDDDIITPDDNPPTPNNYTWPGDAIKILFNNVISSNRNVATGHPGIYDKETNVLGWYSWKVVIKQQEQEYYNIYFPGILNGTRYAGRVVPGNSEDEVGPSIEINTGEFSPASEASPVCNITLHGDNINKIPRDLKNVGPDQKVFRTSRPSKVENPLWYSVVNAEGEEREVLFDDWNSPNARAFTMQRNIELGLVEPQNVENASVKLFCRVDNSGNTHDGHENEQSFPGRIADIVVEIGTGSDLGMWALDAEWPVQFYNVSSNPLVARLEVKDYSLGMDAAPDTGLLPMLAVYETAPEISRLQLFWESTTSGLIKPLNEAIEESFDFVVDGINLTTPFKWEEKNIPQGFFGTAANDARCTVNFSAVNPAGAFIDPAYMSLVSVHSPTSTGGMISVTGRFELAIPIISGVTSTYQAYIYCTDKLWYSENSNHNDYIFSIAVTQNGYSQIKQLQGSVSNSMPFGGYLGSRSLGHGFAQNSKESTPWMPDNRYDDSEFGVYPATCSTETKGSAFGYIGAKSWQDLGHLGFGFQEGIYSRPVYPLFDGPIEGYGVPSPTNPSGFYVNPINYQHQLDKHVFENNKLTKHILDDDDWIFLPIGNGSWHDTIDGQEFGVNPSYAANSTNTPGHTTASNSIFTDWKNDNYPRISNEIDVSVQSVKHLRWHPTRWTPTSRVGRSLLGEMEDLTNILGASFYNQLFKINNYKDTTKDSFPYGILQSRFKDQNLILPSGGSGTLIPSHGFIKNNDIFKVTVKYVDANNSSTSISILRDYYCKLKTDVHVESPKYFPGGQVPIGNPQMFEWQGYYGRRNEQYPEVPGRGWGPCQLLNFDSEIRDWGNEYENGVWTVGAEGYYDIETELRMQLGVQSLAPGDFQIDKNGNPTGRTKPWNCEQQNVNNALVGDIFVYKIPAGVSDNPSDFNSQNIPMTPKVLNEFHNASTVIQMSKQPFSILYKQQQVSNWSYPIKECTNNTNVSPDVGAFSTGHLAVDCLPNGKPDPTQETNLAWTWNGTTGGSAYTPPASLNGKSPDLYTLTQQLGANKNIGVEYFDDYATWEPSQTPLTTHQVDNTRAGKGNIINQLGNPNTSSLNNLTNEYYKKINSVHLNAGDKIFVVVQASWWKFCSVPDAWDSSEPGGAYFWQQDHGNRKGFPGKCALYLNSGSFKATSLPNP